MIDDASLCNQFGEIKFFLVNVSYPATFTTYTDKYIQVIYQGKTYPISELNIWTGNPGQNQGTGIVAAPGTSEFVSPYFNTGGIVLYNPHSNYVDVNILLASSATNINTTVTEVTNSGNSMYFDSGSTQ